MYSMLSLSKYVMIDIRSTLYRLGTSYPGNSEVIDIRSTLYRLETSYPGEL